MLPFCNVNLKPVPIELIELTFSHSYTYAYRSEIWTLRKQEKKKINII